MHFANRVISNHSYVFAGRPVRIVAGRSADSLAKFLEEEIDETITSVPGIGPAAAKKLEAGDDGVSTARRDSAALFFQTIEWHSYAPDPHSCVVFCKFMTGLPAVRSVSDAKISRRHQPGALRCDVVLAPGQGRRVAPQRDCAVLGREVRDHARRDSAEHFFQIERAALPQLRPGSSFPLSAPRFHDRMPGLYQYGS